MWIGMLERLCVCVRVVGVDGYGRCVHFSFQHFISSLLAVLLPSVQRMIYTNLPTGCASHMFRSDKSSDQRRFIFNGCGFFKSRPFLRGFFLLDGNVTFLKCSHSHTHTWHSKYGIFAYFICFQWLLWHSMRFAMLLSVLSPYSFQLKSIFNGLGVTAVTTTTKWAQVTCWWGRTSIQRTSGKERERNKKKRKWLKVSSNVLFFHHRACVCVCSYVLSTNEWRMAIYYMHLR